MRTRDSSTRTDIPTPIPAIAPLLNPWPTLVCGFEVGRTAEVGEEEMKEEVVVFDAKTVDKPR